MESRNITLTLDKAKEWYKQGGELKEVALQAYTENELTMNGLPRTWEEFCENYPIKGIEWNISSAAFGLPTKEAAEAHLALMQLHQLRDCYRQGWVPDWRKENIKYAIVTDCGNKEIRCCLYDSRVLSFQTPELAEEFLVNFRDLIEKAGDLI